jgi:hypothetical protein
MAHQDQVLQERRQDVRRPLHITALLDRHGLTPRVVIVDYSRGGLRIDRAFEVAVGEHVTVELLSGHRIPVEVVWAVGAQIGVRFLGPIQPGHPAMVALEEAAKKYKRVHRPTKVT